MPELPEVEATRVLLNRQMLGRAVVKIAADRGEEALAPLLGQTVGPWGRRGKRLVAPLGEALQLQLHLGMTGKIVSDPPAARAHVRVTLTLDDGGRIGFVDTRRFGSLEISAKAVDPFHDLGPDALELLTGIADPGGALAGCLLPRGRSTAVLKDRALDQGRLAGLGNIAIIEGAHRACLHPHLPVAALSESDWTALAHGICAHLEDTLADCLAVAEVLYVSEGGPNPFAVYGREGEPCPRCREAAIIRLVRANRPTFVCPRCQPGSIRSSP